METYQKWSLHVMLVSAYRSHIMIDNLFGGTFEWANANQGVLAIALFAATIFLGWVSGIFSALRRKPKLRIRTKEGPTFIYTFGTGQKFQGYDTHRTGIALYLELRTSVQLRRALIKSQSVIDGLSNH